MDADLYDYLNDLLNNHFLDETGISVATKLYETDNDQWYIIPYQGRNLCLLLCSDWVEVPYRGDEDFEYQLRHNFLPDHVSVEQFLKDVDGLELWD